MKSIRLLDINTLTRGGNDMGNSQRTKDCHKYAFYIKDVTLNL